MRVAPTRSAPMATMLVDALAVSCTVKTGTSDAAAFTTIATDLIGSTVGTGVPSPRSAATRETNSANSRKFAALRTNEATSMTGAPGEAMPDLARTRENSAELRWGVPGRVSISGTTGGR